MRKKIQRIMLKLSGEAFQGSKRGGIHKGALQSIVSDIKAVKKERLQIAITVGGGNIWRYRDCKDLPLERSDSDYLGMLATVFNAKALCAEFAEQRISAVACSCVAIPQVLPVYDRPTMRQYLSENTVVILAGGTGNPYFTTDSAAALHGLELECDILLKATKVDYVYNKDPMKYPSAKHYTNLTFAQVLKEKLNVIDATAISLCQEGGLPIRVFHFLKKGNLLKVCKSEDVGTLIS